MIVETASKYRQALIGSYRWRESQSSGVVFEFYSHECCHIYKKVIYFLLKKMKIVQDNVGFGPVTVYLLYLASAFSQHRYGFSVF